MTVSYLMQFNRLCLNYSIRYTQDAYSAFPRQRGCKMACCKCRLPVTTMLHISVTTFHTFPLPDTTLATWHPSKALSNQHVIYIHNHKYMPYTSKFIIRNIFHKIFEATIIIYMATKICWILRMTITNNNLGQTWRDAHAYHDIHLKIITENIEDLSRIFWTTARSIIAVPDKFYKFSALPNMP